MVGCIEVNAPQKSLLVLDLPGGHEYKAVTMNDPRVAEKWFIKTKLCTKLAAVSIYRDDRSDVMVEFNEKVGVICFAIIHSPR